MNPEQLVEKLNNECEYKDNTFREWWDVEDIRVRDDTLDFERSYCYFAYKDFDLCDTCRRNLKLHPDYIRNKQAIYDRFMRKKLIEEFGEEARESLQSNIDQNEE